MAYTRENMSNCKYIHDDIYQFSGFLVTQDEYGFDVELSPKASAIDILYKMHFSLLIQNGSLAPIGKEIQITTDSLVDYYLFRESAKTDFVKFLTDYNFPKINNARKPYVCLEDAFSSRNSFWKILYPLSISEFGPIDSLHFKRQGYILLTPSTNQIYGSMNIFEYKLHKTIEEINLIWSRATQLQKYQLLGKIQEVSKSANAVLDKTYSNLKIISPKKIVPDIIQDAKGFSLVSGVDIDDINQNDFHNHVMTRNSIDNIYTVKNNRNENIKILLSDEHRQILSDIKKVRNVSENEIQNFLENPPENWNDEIVDASNLYSDRVIGWQLSEPVFAFNQNFIQNNWFENAENIEDSDRLSFTSQNQEQKLKKDLIIKDNEEVIDYTEEYNAFVKGYVCPQILGDYKPGIAAKKYQQEGIAWLYSLYKKKNHGCILADDMGLGKTFQVLSFLQSISDTFLNILIVAPASLIQNWENEYYNFFNEVRFRIIRASQAKVQLDNLLNQQISRNKTNCSNIFIASYENIRSCNTYIKIQWDIVILDEAQKIKNPQTLTNKTARSLKANFRIAVTGTPVENSFSDIWAISDFICPGLLGSHKQFKQKFGINAADNKEILLKQGKKIREVLGEFFLRRLKEEHLPELPAKEFIRKYEYMPKLQTHVYEQVLSVASRTNELAEKLKILQKLKQVSDHYSFIKKYDTKEYSFSDTAKTISLATILQEIQAKKEKVIIFAEFIHTQEILATIIQDMFKITPQIYNGSVSLQARENILNRFKKSSGFNIIIMSPIVAGVGLTITEANHVIHFSRHWNPAKEDQATDRAFRIGQTKTVYVYTLIGKIPGITSFDEKLDYLLSAKQNIKGAALFPSTKLDILECELINILNHPHSSS